MKKNRNEKREGERDQVDEVVGGGRGLYKKWMAKVRHRRRWLLPLPRFSSTFSFVYSILLLLFLHFATWFASL